MVSRSGLRRLRACRPQLVCPRRPQRPRPSTARADVHRTRRGGHRRRHVHRAAVDRGRREDPFAWGRRPGVRPILRHSRHAGRSAVRGREKRSGCRRGNWPLRPRCGPCRGSGRRSRGHAYSSRVGVFVAGWRGITASMPPPKPNTPALSARRETPAAACGHSPALCHRGRGETAPRGRAKRRQRTGIARTSTRSPPPSGSMRRTSRATLTIWTEMGMARLARAFRAGRNAKSPPRQASFLSTTF
jgi:hypothetical protein